MLLQHMVITFVSISWQADRAEGGKTLRSILACAQLVLELLLHITAILTKGDTARPPDVMLSLCCGLPCQTRVPYGQRSRLDLGQAICSGKYSPKRCNPSQVQLSHGFSRLFHSQRGQLRTVPCQADEGTPGVTELSDNLPPVLLDCLHSLSIQEAR